MSPVFQSRCPTGGRKNKKNKTINLIVGVHYHVFNKLKYLYLSSERTGVQKEMKDDIMITFKYIGFNKDVVIALGY